VIDAERSLVEREATASAERFWDEALEKRGCACYEVICCGRPRRPLKDEAFLRSREGLALSIDIDVCEQG
jgi:hypothetical protein